MWHLDIVTMRSILNHLCAYGLLSSSVCAGAISYSNDLSKWVVMTTLVADSSAFSDYEWLVYLDAGRPMARLASAKARSPRPLPFTIKEGTYAEGLDGRRLNVKVDDGWIVAFNAGEWGAGLWWFSNDGQQREKISSNKYWINQFIPTESGLLAIEGLAHAFNDDGGVVRIARGDDGHFHTKRCVWLNEATVLASRDADGTLVVATLSRLLRVEPSRGKVEVLMRDVPWNGRYPTSMVIAPDGRIYVGFLDGVARFEKEVGKAARSDWLIPFPGFERLIKVHKGFH